MREPIDIQNWHPLSRRVAFLARPATRRNFVWFLLAGLVLTSFLGLFVVPKKYAPWDFFASWSMWGFLSYCTVVLASWPMFRITARAVGYYGRDEWTGGYGHDARLAPTVPPEDHGDEIHRNPPLETAPEDDPFATMPADRVADVVDEAIVRPLRLKGLERERKARRLSRKQVRRDPGSDGNGDGGDGT